LLKGAGLFNKIKKINNKMFSYYRRIKKHRKLYEKTAKNREITLTLVENRTIFNIVN